MDFLRQSDQPLFPEILWNKPITKRAAKQLLLVGGYSGHLVRIQQAYQYLKQAGLGTVKLALPDATQALIGPGDHNLYLPSTSSGSLAKSALPELLTFAQGIDGTWLAGDFSKHPASSVIIEGLLERVNTPLIISDETINLIPQTPKLLSKHSNRLLLSGTQQLIKLAGLLDLGIEIGDQGSLLNKIELAKRLSSELQISIILLTTDVIVADNDQISVTNTKTPDFLKISAFAATYFAQHRDRFQALTTAVHQAIQK